jgi:hypothetical protein
MLPQPRHLRKEQRGSAMLESALILVVFLTMIIGIGDFSLALFIHESLVERVREGLRYGVITYDPTAIQNMVLYGAATPPDGATPSFNLTSSMVQVARLDAKAPEDRVTITVANYPIEFFSPFIAGRITGKPIVGVQSMELGNLP